MFDSVFKKPFKAAKCKTLLRLATSRIKLLRNKRDGQLKQLKRELAKLLETNQEPSAHIRVEHIYREQNIMAAYDIIELLCDLLVARLPIIVSQRQCPIDLREAVASIIFAAPRCSDIPELQEIRSLFTTKYGKEFTAIAAELRPDCGVNRVVVEKLSVRGPSMEVKLKLMKDIATEQGLDWDPTDLESQNLKSPEDLLDGPSQFFGASQMSMQKSFKEPSTNEPISPQQMRNVVAEAKTPVVQNTEFLDEKQFIPFVRPIVEDNFSPSSSQSNSRMQWQSSSSNYSSHGLSATLSHKYDEEDDSQRALDRRMSSKGATAAAHAPNYSSHGLSATVSHKYDEHNVLDRRMSLKGVAAAARAAAESAEHAAAAARAAALLASEKLDRNIEESSSDCESDNDGESDNNGDEDNHLNSGRVPPDDSSTSRMPLFDEPMEGKGSHRMHSSGKNPLSYDESREEQSVSFSTQSYNFDDTESLSHSTSRMPLFDEPVEGKGSHRMHSSGKNPLSYDESREEQSVSFSRESYNFYDTESLSHTTIRHNNDQASRQRLDHSISSSNNWHYQHNNTNLFKTGSSATAGAAPSFDPGNKPADEGAQSRPPERPPPQLPGAQLPTLTKSTSFVHPKLPDCDELTAHFQALKAMRSKK